MAIQVCPTTIVRAPAERIWRLLTIPGELARWTGTRLLTAPNPTLVAGDRLVLGAGLGGRVSFVFDVLEIDPPRRLALAISLPFGINNHEIIVIAPISPAECRVTYN